MIPQDFGTELPRRCLELLDGLSPHVPTGPSGHLNTTFLLTVAMPLIVFPHQVLNGADRLVMGDVNRLSPTVRAAMTRPWADVPFRGGGRWYMAELDGKPRHPDDLQAATPGLITPAAATKADVLEADQVLRRLRHALSHAGVVYLDEAGLYRPARDAFMLAFVFEFGGRNNRRHGVITVSEPDFRAFLRAWARWLSDQGFGRVAAAA